VARVWFWILGLGYRLGHWLIRVCEVSYCVHAGCRNPAVTSVLVEGSGDPPVRGAVCAECVHKHLQWETVE
jgi:hypothetical protein